ncbi:MAG: hypothetical protein K9M44_00165 [Candidatus Pacebacteria bacterium]|nr:hypothetical protein [Candidatus Paceibacterota bacterium]
MNIIVKIEGEEKTNLVDWESFGIEDNINEQPNLCNFTIKVFEGQNYKPEISDIVEVFDGAEKIFAGKIIRVGNYAEGDVIYYEIETKDYTLDLDRILVIERFENKTVNEIIEFLVTNYLASTGITYNNVNCNLEVTVVAFNNLSVSKCLTELCELFNYSWYIDYERDIHFFAKNDEPAPFNIADSSDNYIRDSLSIENDLSQLRNVVIIEGGEITSDNERTKPHTGDGNQKSFATDYKFSKKPTVKVNSIEVSVGTEFLNSDDDYDCLWSYNEKYVRFVVPPVSGDLIEISGYYLIPIMAQVEDNASISRYGRFEFKKIDKSIKTTNEAKQYGEAQLSAYANTIREGGFRTYLSGLSSGQTISINLSTRSINENFLIMRVSLKMFTATEGEWTVELATLKTLGMISFLQSLLVGENKKVTLNENAVLKKYYLDYQDVQVDEEIGVVEEMEDYKTIEVAESIEKDPFGAGVRPTFVLAPYIPVGHADPEREFCLDTSELS